MNIRSYFETERKKEVLKISFWKVEIWQENKFLQTEKNENFESVAVFRFQVWNLVNDDVKNEVKHAAKMLWNAEHEFRKSKEFIFKLLWTDRLSSQKPLFEVCTHSFLIREVVDKYCELINT